MAPAPGALSIDKFSKVDEIPFDFTRRMMSVVVEGPDGRRELLTKGAPEAVAHLCHLEPGELEAVRHAVDAMAAEGLRVLGVAKAVHAGPPWPQSQPDFPFVFLGLVGLAGVRRKFQK